MADAAALKAQANAAFSAKDFSKASDLYSQAIEVDGSNHVLYSNRSASKASLKDFAGALEDAEKCIELNDGFVKGYARKGAALHGLGRYEDAVFAYDQGLEKEPTNTALKSGLESVKKAMDSNSPFGAGENPMASMFSDPNLIGKLASNPRTSKFMADPSFVQKIRDLQSGKANADMANILQDQRMLAVLGVAMGVDMQSFERPEGSNEMPEGLKKELNEDTDMPDARPSASSSSSSSAPRRSATVEDEPEPSKPSASKPAASKPQPKAPEPAAEPMDVEPTEDDLKKKKAAELKAEGTAAYKSRDFDSAVKAFQSAWDESPSDITFLTNLAAVYFEQGEYEKCIEACNKAVEEGRSLRADYKVIAKAMARIGSAYEKQGNLELAVKNYGKALTEHRTPETLTKLRNAEKAKADAEKQAYINPELAEQAREAGNVQFKAGQFADAVKSYTEAIKRLPSDPRGYNNRAAAYNKLAALPEALKDAEEAVKIDPSFVKAYLRQSTVLLGMKEPTKAMEACQAATEADSEKKHTREIEAQMMKCANDTYQQRQGETDEQALERAMRDPEVAKIMNDPVMQSILQQSQSDPKALQDHMKNPMIKAKIQKLIAAGIIRTR